MTNQIEITGFIVNSYFGRVSGEEFSVEIPRDDNGKLQYDQAKSTVALDPKQLQEAVEFASLIEVSKVVYGSDDDNKRIIESLFKRRGNLYGRRILEKAEGGKMIEDAFLNKRGDVVWAVREQGSLWESIGNAA